LLLPRPLVCFLGQVRDLSYLRLRKEDFWGMGYSVSMKLDSTWTVEQTLAAYPHLASVFLTLKTDCAGCALDRFCTLAEVAAAYELPLEVLLERLRERIPISTRGEAYE